MHESKYKGVIGGKMIATCERYGTGRATVEQIAKAANAKVKLGGTAFFLWDRMDNYLAELADKQAKENEA